MWNPPASWPFEADLIALYGGKERKLLAEVTATQPELVSGDFALPPGLTPSSGRAVEVWAEREAIGERALSQLIFVGEAPKRLPSAGGFPATTFAILIGLLALALVVGGYAILTRTGNGR